MHIQIFKQPVLKLFIVVVSFFLLNCAHKLDPIQYSSTASPSEEIEKLGNSLRMSMEDQVDVLAPKPFKTSQNLYDKARDQNTSGENPKNVFESLGYSRAYLNLAKVEAKKAEGHFEGLIAARESALVAGSRNLSDEMEELDEEFIELTEDPDSLKDITAEEKSTLQAKYLNLQLLAVKNNHLKDAKDLLSLTRKKGAEEYTPKAFKEAVQHYDIAEKTIETDRNNLEKVEAAALTATLSAKRVANLLEAAKASKNQSPEERAVLLERREQELKEADARASEKEMMLIERDSELSQQSARLGVVESRNLNLSQKAKEEKQVRDAAARFTEDEAEVYSQDGHLVIRLKKMNFASGRSDLPSQSLPVLAKVKEVIQELDSKHVLVEGHTDSVGSVASNQNLSEKRASIVAQHFIVDKVINKNNIETVGYGFSKPLATNKTKEGREKNRRVDIFIKTH